MTVMAPKDENELRHMLYTAMQHSGPAAIRYPRGTGVGVPLDPEYKTIPIGESEILREGKDLLIIALGSMVSPSMEAATILQNEGLSVGVVNCRFVKPLDKSLAEQARSVGKVLVVEENIRQGGLGSALLELLNESDMPNVRLKRIGLPDKFVEHGPLALLREKYGLDHSGILKEARDLCRQG
jgi:1-deoxy-D-xylulose-5-phosphate synthase